MILAIIVTYFPDKKLLEKNVSALIESVDKVLIWENTPPEKRKDYRFINHEKVEYHGDGINSISHALNYAWHYAQEGGYSYLLTMDQDSHFKDFNLYLKRTIYSKDAPAGIFTPSYEDMRVEVRSDYEELDRPITSGMLIPIPLIDKIGGWDEDFHIDAVDDEFCLHAHTLSIKIYAVQGIEMQHCLGTPETKKFLGHTLTLRNYSPTRLYGIYRNNVILLRKYPQFKYIRDDFKHVLLKQLVCVLLLEDDKFRKLSAALRGCLSGLKKTIK